MNSIPTNSKATEHAISSSMYTMDTIFTDQTRKFPDCSQSGHHYLIEMIELNSSTILAKVIKTALKRNSSMHILSYYLDYTNPESPHKNMS
ncbi:LOW QUALITY PROTEIN: hypothetical protein ACHAW6_004661 [Cyclotella cf. meneghiniana]